MSAALEETDDQMRALLHDAKTIAVVGAKDDEAEDAYRIPLYMQQAGYRAGHPGGLATEEFQAPVHLAVVF